MQLLATVAVIAIAAATLARAQVRSPGQFRPDPFTESLASPRSTFSLPTLNNAQLRLAAEHDRPGPYKFGEAIPIDVDMGKGHGEWTEDAEAGVRKWRAVIRSKDAKSISVLFREFYLPDRAEFYVVRAEYVVGAYTGRVNNKEDGRFSVQPIFGEAVMLEYIEPIEGSAADRPRIAVEKVVHAFRAMDTGEAGPCNIDVRCPIGKKKQIDAVAVMLTDQGQRFCSGVMLNNSARDGSQWFLTASHCVYTDQSHFILGFNYQYSACRSGGAQAALTMPQTVHGMKLVAQYNNSDFALFLVTERIPDSYNVFLAGWDNRKIAPQNVAGIHHPSGDVKKISSYNGATKPASWTEGASQYHWEVPFWLYGVTEPGSSGSALFNNRGLVVGHLHGGQSSCDFRTGYDMYGAFWADWAAVPNSKINSLAHHLNPLNRPVLALGGVYLKTLAKRNVPNVAGIKPLYKTPRPRMLGTGRIAVGKEDVPPQDDAPDGLLTKSSHEAELVNDLSDNDENQSPDTVDLVIHEALAKRAAAFPHCVARNVPLMLK